MTFGMALMSRILTGDEPCLRKVQYQRTYEMPRTSGLIMGKLRHEYMVSKVVNGLNGEIIVNYPVKKELKDVILRGRIDILSITSEVKTIYEIKAGKERDCHHVQLWLYMGCFESVNGVLLYSGTRYLYSSKDIPRNLWNLVLKRVRPLLTDKLLPAVKGNHCEYCNFKSICKREVVSCLMK